MLLVEYKNILVLRKKKFSLIVLFTYLKIPNYKFNFSPVSEETILKLLKSMDEEKAAAVDNLSGKFLKNGTSILAKPISQICNLFIKYSQFPIDYKIANLKPILQKRF